MARIIFSIFIAFYMAEAVVDVGTSRIYDEFDFKGQSTVAINDICGDSCHIYASMTPDSKKLAVNLLFQLPKGFVSVAEIAAKVDPGTGQKLFLEVNNTASLSIINANVKEDAGPLVLYVVKNYGLYSGAEIYEADGFHRQISSFPASVTVLSARPFSLRQAPYPDRPLSESAQGAYATMSGYDATDKAVCPRLFYTVNSPFPGFNLEIDGPILTIIWDPEFQVAPGDLTATIGITNKRKLERSGWVGSPGNHGCYGKLPYRSSLYDVSSPFHAEVFNDTPESIHLEVLTNSDSNHAVVLQDVEFGGYYSISDTGDTPVPANFVSTKNLSINWTPDGTVNTHFLARWNSTAVFHV
ncbi:hypothetical protein PMAYCL1PPCAC_09714 [Pristionchus mayeri]|uniref:Uncharacterized protein n=1 Tax=Pristionchus mayeri TaxID=1317129 RepID=A0AAN4ZGI4_9BILA|nr:hypothetical protein PMAYCL1PPCAC_09714 [Pristionchus mayeri]